MLFQRGVNMLSARALCRSMSPSRTADTVCMRCDSCGQFAITSVTAWPSLESIEFDFTSCCCKAAFVMWFHTLSKRILFETHWQNASLCFEKPGVLHMQLVPFGKKYDQNSVQLEDRYKTSPRFLTWLKNATWPCVAEHCVQLLRGVWNFAIGIGILQSGVWNFRCRLKLAFAARVQGDFK